jgi:hypothetical protein
MRRRLIGVAVALAVAKAAAAAAGGTLDDPLGR